MVELYLCDSSIMKKPLAEYPGTILKMLKQVRIETPTLGIIYNVCTKQEAVISILEERDVSMPTYLELKRAAGDIHKCWEILGILHDQPYS